MAKPSAKLAGFSLLEMMVSIAILLVVAAIAFSFLIQYQNYYQSSTLKADMHSGLRAATTLLEQEIGQAGLVSFSATCSAGIPITSTSSCPTVCPASSACASTGITTPGSQTVPVSSTAGMFVGENIQVDVGQAQEVVAITGIGTSPASITAKFANSHPQSAPPGAVLGVTGMFPQGILSPGQTGGSSATQLNMIGDLIGDGNLYYVQYNCNMPPWSPVTYSSSYAAWSSSTTYASGANVNYNGTSYVSNTSSNVGNAPTTPGTLTRSVTQLAGSSPATAQGAAVTLLDDLGANPGGTACFQYVTKSVGPPTIAGTTTYFFTTTVSVTLTVQTSEIDPITKIPSQETKSFLNLVPRNILAGYNLASAGFSNYIQLSPSALCTAAGITCASGSTCC